MLDDNKGKVIFIDWSVFLHKAVFAWESQRKTMKPGDLHLPAHYTAMTMILGCLKRVGVKRDDLMIVAMDGRGNWRRDIDPNYKANRKAIKQKDEIDWLDWYKKFDNLVEKLKVSAPFYFIQIPKLEADDLISVGVRHYKDKECVIISTDGDFEQLVAFDNVKLFSPITKEYKYVPNPYKSLADKIKKEVTDNLLSPILDEADFNRRHMLVNLLQLPLEVEKKVLDELAKVVYNKFNPALFPFKKMSQQFEKIYDDDLVVSYEKCILKKIKKKKAKGKKSNGTNTGTTTNLQGNSQITGW